MVNNEKEPREKTKNVKISNNLGMKLMQEEWDLYQELSHGLNELHNAMVAFRQRETKQK
ncbi:MAG TPA: hypothetical protein VEP90_17620 [Methylomirabilota bacterium]|nr:hypothetical protein [Methylomirabilota bacterium]